MSLNQGNFLSRQGLNPPHSPHKLNRGNKLRRYEESKQSVNQQDMQELQRNFSPINSQKTFGIRIGLTNQKKVGGQFESPELKARTIMNG